MDSKSLPRSFDKRLIQYTLFFAAGYPISTVAFTLIAASLSMMDVSPIGSFVVALSISSVLLFLIMYALYALKKKLPKRIKQ